jgi:ribosomal protein L9
MPNCKPTSPNSHLRWKQYKSEILDKINGNTLKSRYKQAIEDRKGSYRSASDQLRKTLININMIPEWPKGVPPGYFRWYLKERGIQLVGKDATFCDPDRAARIKKTTIQVKKEYRKQLGEEAYAKKVKERLQAMRDSKTYYWSKLSDEDLKALHEWRVKNSSENIQKFFNSMTSEEMADWKKKHGQKISVGRAKWWASLTQEEKDAWLAHHTEICRKSQLERIANMTPEEFEVFNKYPSETIVLPNTQKKMYVQGSYEKAFALLCDKLNVDIHRGPSLTGLKNTIWRPDFLINGDLIVEVKGHPNAIKTLNEKLSNLMQAYFHPGGLKKAITVVDWC